MLEYEIMEGINLKEDIMIKNSSRVDFSLPEKLDCHFAGRRKTAFTLAEVLITLGIIGIVAAIIIPGLVGAYQKRVTETTLKKVYSSLSQAIRMAESEHGIGFDVTDMLVQNSWCPENAERVFGKYLAPYLKVNFKYSQDECDNLLVSHPQSNPSATYTDTNAACYSLADGAVIAFWVGRGGTNSAYIPPIYVILRPTRKLKLFGREIFAFAMSNKNNAWTLSTVVNTRYPNLTRDELIEKCNANTGRIVGDDGYHTSPSGYCTELIRRDGWQIKDDYPIKF